MDKEKILPKSFRITEDTSAKFREITKELDLKNQEETMSKLIELYELQKGKEALPEMKETIDTFEEHLKVASSMFMLALENNQTMRSMVRTEYEDQLRSKDKLIMDLQNTIADLDDAKNEAVNLKEELLNKISSLEEKLTEQISDSEKERTEYEKRIEDLKKQNEKMQKSYDELNDTYLHFRDTSRVIQNELELTRGQLEHIRTENDELAAKCDNAQKGYEAAIKNAKDLDALITTKNKQIADLKKEYTDDLRSQKEQLDKEFSFEKEQALFELKKELTEEYQKKMAELIAGKTNS